MKYLIAGSNGQLGKEFVRELERLGNDYTAFDIDEVDIADLNAVNSVFESARPQIVINCAAYNQVDAAEKEYQLAFNANAFGVKNLASASKKYDAFMIHYSSDYVFDGEKKDGLYTEEDAPKPSNAYGKSKLSGEILLEKELENFLIFRLSWVFGEGKQNFIYKLNQWAQQQEYLKIVCDETSVPTYTKTIVDVTLKALDKGLTGIYHLTNSGYASRYEWAKLILKTLGINKFIYPSSISDFNLPARRPKFSAMSNEKISKLLNIDIPDWETAVQHFINQLEKK